MVTRSSFAIERERVLFPRISAILKPMAVYSYGLGISFPVSCIQARQGVVTLAGTLLPLIALSPVR